MSHSRLGQYPVEADRHPVLIKLHVGVDPEEAVVVAAGLGAHRQFGDDRPGADIPGQREIEVRCYLQLDGGDCCCDNGCFSFYCCFCCCC